MGSGPGGRGGVTQPWCGKALLDEALERARERGCFALELESAVWRERAHAFYLREGMKQGGHSFVTLLVDMEWPPRPR